MDLSFSAVKKMYAAGVSLRPLIMACLDRCREEDPAIWIHLLSNEEVESYLLALESRAEDNLPLYGIPFVIKDNIDLAGVPTTAGCPEYSYLPTESAFVVQQLITAGAVPLAKTNMDQFATGLVGTRSPYGACGNSFNPEYIAGGSSSGSAVAVAKGLCSFSLGTDTAGSGRVPAALNNILGVKPTRGLLSTRGVVPACRSLDCVSIFALCAGDAGQIMRVAACYDSKEPYSRKKEWGSGVVHAGASFTFGIPAREQLQFFGNLEYENCFMEILETLNTIGGKCVEIDFSPFLAAARLLYDGPWVAERSVAVGDFLRTRPEVGHPVTREIICSGKPQSAEDLFRAMHKLQELKMETDTLLRPLDVLVTPTVGTCYTMAEVAAEPIRLNANLGYYTNYMNLLDYCSLAVPAGMTSTLPFGVTLTGPAFADERLLCLGARLHEAVKLPMGAGEYLPPGYSTSEQGEDSVHLVVCGAHLQGLSLHYQLQDLGARLIRRTETAPCYRMYALSKTPARPGLVRDEKEGKAIEVEVYALSVTAFGHFTSEISHPLGIGKLELESGEWLPGFIAEPLVSHDGVEITVYKGWRAYLQSI